MNQDFFKKALDACVEYRKQLAEQTNEVARLRELLNRSIPWIEAYDCGNTPCTCDGLEELIIDIKEEIPEELAKLAPAPEEPVIQDSRITEPNPRCDAGFLSDYRCENVATLKTNTGYICCEHHAPMVNGKWRDDVVPLSEKTTKVSDKEPVPEWRELGPDEVIQEGDEFQEKQYDPIKNKWYTINGNSMVGKKVSDSDWGRFRTRRPLPKQKEKPLHVIEQSLKWIEGDGKYPLDQDEMFGEVVNCLRYLRDEILKLKQK